MLKHRGNVGEKAQPPVIYFVQGTLVPLIKIGFASNIYARFKAMQVGSPDKLRVILLLNSEDGLEESIHRRFAYLRQHGEWFSPEKELLDYIEDLKEYAVYTDEY